MSNIIIPSMFTRTRYCKKCAANQLPYNTIERVTRGNLHYLVVGQHNVESELYKIREQTKTAVIGYTPHIFFVESVKDDFFELTCACSIHGCGTHVYHDMKGYPHADVHNSETLFMNRREVLELLKFKDIKYMLDYKEKQWYYHPSIFSELTPN